MQLKVGLITIRLNYGPVYVESWHDGATERRHTFFCVITPNAG